MNSKFHHQKQFHILKITELRTNKKSNVKVILEGRGDVGDTVPSLRFLSLLLDNKHDN